jgi:small subunit ribosomal protein S2
MKYPLYWGHSRFGIAQNQGWHPDSTYYNIGERDGIVIGIPGQYKRAVLRASIIISEISNAEGEIWIVNTTPSLSHIVTIICENKEVSYSAYGWMPGTLTNWPIVSKSVLAYGLFTQSCYSIMQREHLIFPRYKRIHRMFKGLVSKSGLPKSLPDIIVIVDPSKNKRILEEANRLHIPVIGFLESDTSCQGINYPVPIQSSHPRHIYNTLSLLLSNVARK